MNPQFGDTVTASAEQMPAYSKPPRRILWLAAALFSLKAVFLFVLVPGLQELSPDAYHADMFSDGYDLIAMNVVQGNGYRMFPDTAETMIRTPGFVLILAGVFWVFGKSLLAVKAFNLLVSAGTAYLVYRLGTKVTRSSLCGGVAACFCFLYPGMVIADSRGGLETLFAFSIVLFMLLLYRALERGYLLSWAAAGGAFGLMLLVRSTAALFPVLLMALLLSRADTTREALRRAKQVAVLGLAAALAMSPWIIRNFELTGKFIPTMTVGGLAAFQGLYILKSHDTGKEYFEVMDEAVSKQLEIADALQMQYRGKWFPQFYSSLDEVRYYSHLGHLVLEDYKSSPGLVATALASSAISFWIQGRTRTATLINTLVIVPVLALAICGWFMARARKMETMPILLLLAACLFAHLPILALARHHIPLMPLMAIFAAIPVTQILVSLGLAGSGEIEGSTRVIDTL